MKKIKIKISGRPGWHIECSVMSQKFLNTDTLDIHAGGVDLIFPHHENEIAQAESLTKKPFAKYWIHHGLLSINGQKMAKSLGNFVTIKDILDKYPSDVLKIIYLQAHYSSPMDFSWEKMEEAKQALQRILILMDKLKQPKATSSRLSAKELGKIENIKNKFIEAMDDDFNTPEGLANIFDLVNLANKNIENSNFVIKASQTLKELLNIFAISLKTDKKAGLITDAEIEVSIQQRNKARESKDFILADKIRKELEAKGIVLEDTKEGTTWRRKL